jgi:MoxR-like ATPase
VELGASPCGSVALTQAAQAAQALALIQGRTFVTPQMVKQVAVPVLGHRLVLRHQSTLGGKASAEVMQEVLRQVAVPVSAGAA